MVKPKTPFIRGRGGACSKHLSSLLPGNNIKVKEENQFQKLSSNLRMHVVACMCPHVHIKSTHTATMIKLKKKCYMGLGRERNQQSAGFVSRKT